MIRVENLSKRFGDVEAVRNVSMDIGRGELFCFLGPNGAGKTTTIKMMCGLLRPNSGTIQIGGFDVMEESTEVRKITGYIPDTPFLYDLLTVTEFLRFTGDLYGLGRNGYARETGELVEFFGLVNHQGSLIKDLSHGLRQRLVYAATLLQKPQIMFVDEPFVGLDPHSIRAIKELLRKKVENGMTIFLTTHILPLAEALADRIGIISQGELIAVGSVADISAKNKVAGDLEDLFIHLTE